MKKKKPRKRCKVCGHPHVPYAEYNDYCWKHIPEENRCSAPTRQERRCRIPAIPGTTLCKEHTRKRKPRKIKEKSPYTGGRGPGYIYVIDLGHDEHYYKIGQSIDCEQRLHDLKAANPWASIIYSGVVWNASYIEKKIHHTYDDMRIEREIFHLNHQELIEVINIIKENNHGKDIL